MSNDNLRIAQREALAAIQQMKLQSSAALALQMQLAQKGGPFRAEGASVGENAAGEQHLVFSLAETQLAVKAEFVQGVERLGDMTSVPNVVPWIKGVMNLRGSIVSVVDLRPFLGLEHLSSTPRTRLLSMQQNEMVICLVVDGVSEMLPISPSAIINGNTRQATIPQWAVPYAAGCALLANRVVVLLDVARLLFSEKMQHYEALG